MLLNRYDRFFFQFQVQKWWVFFLLNYLVLHKSVENKTSASRIWLILQGPHLQRQRCHTVLHANLKKKESACLLFFQVNSMGPSLCQLPYYPDHQNPWAVYLDILFWKKTKQLAGIFVELLVEAGAGEKQSFHYLQLLHMLSSISLVSVCFILNHLPQHKNTCPKKQVKTRSPTKSQQNRDYGKSYQKQTFTETTSAWKSFF